MRHATVSFWRLRFTMAGWAQGWVPLKMCHRGCTVEVYSSDGNRRVVPVLPCYVTKKQVMFKQGVFQTHVDTGSRKEKITVHIFFWGGCLGVTENLSFLTSAKVGSCNSSIEVIFFTFIECVFWPLLGAIGLWLSWYEVLYRIIEDGRCGRDDSKASN